MSFDFDVESTVCALRVPSLLLPVSGDCPVALLATVQFGHNLATSATRLRVWTHGAPVLLQNNLADAGMEALGSTFAERATRNLAAGTALALPEALEAEMSPDTRAVYRHADSLSLLFQEALTAFQEPLGESSEGLPIRKRLELVIARQSARHFLTAELLLTLEAAAGPGVHFGALVVVDSSAARMVADSFAAAQASGCRVAVMESRSNLLPLMETLASIVAMEPDAFTSCPAHLENLGVLGGGRGMTFDVSAPGPPRLLPDSTGTGPLLLAKRIEPFKKYRVLRICSGHDLQDLVLQYSSGMGQTHSLHRPALSQDVDMELLLQLVPGSCLFPALAALVAQDMPPRALLAQIMVPLHAMSRQLLALRALTDPDAGVVRALTSATDVLLEAAHPWFGAQEGLDAFRAVVLPFLKPDDPLVAALEFHPLRPDTPSSPMDALASTYCLTLETRRALAGLEPAAGLLPRLISRPALYAP